MKVTKYYRNPDVLILDDFAPKKIFQDALNEAISNKKSFEQSTTMGKTENYRTNKVAYLDNLFNQDRSKSKILKHIDNIIRDGKFHQLLMSFRSPFSEIPFTTTHETQLSWYNNKEFYKWHVDAFSTDKRRIITIVWYLCKPKGFKGGELVISDAPLFNDKPVGDNKIEVPIQPNRAVVFDSCMPHAVNPVQNSGKIENARFSVNVWIGFR